MPGINQLPPGSEGAAALSLTYSSTSWTCGVLMIYLTWLHDERLSYVAIVAYWCTISTTASIIQQAHDITWWGDITLQQFVRKTSFFDKPEVAVANASFGLDLVLFYIQYYSYNVEAMSVMFWASELAQSLYGLDRKPRWRRKLLGINKAGKIIAMVFPLITILLLRAPAIQRSFIVFFILADLPLIISLSIGSSTMIAIIIRYVRTQKRFSGWGSSNEEQSNELPLESLASGAGVSRSPIPTNTKKQGILDRWLMVRFTCAFVVLAIFGVTNTLFQVTAAVNNRKDIGSHTPDLSASRTNSTLFLFLPGVSPGIFLFIVFGTTTGHRKALYESFVPKKWQKPPGSRSIQFSWRSTATLARSRIYTASRGSVTKPSLLPIDREPIRRSALMRPLPPPPPHCPRSIFCVRKGSSSQIEGRKGDIFSGASTTRMTELEATYNNQERRCYGLYMEQSDDSGPVLPIMKTNDCSE